MPGSNERSVQLIGSTAQITECVSHFLEDISKVWKKRLRGHLAHSGAIFLPCRKSLVSPYICTSLDSSWEAPWILALVPPGGVVEEVLLPSGAGVGEAVVEVGVG